MKKRLFFYMLLLIMAFIITGCGNTSKGTEKTNKNIEAKINDDVIELNSNTNFKDMYYKENMSELNRDTMGSFRVYTYRKDGNVLLELRIAYIENNTLDDVKKNIPYETQLVKINGTDCLYGSSFINDPETGSYKSRQYYCEYNNILYGINFVSNEDISSFEQVFIDNVYFK